MLRLRNPFVFTRRLKLVEARCFRCGKITWLSKDNIRVINYCTECK
jgi:uncharacterized C2H2 Zn-finger protein